MFIAAFVIAAPLSNLLAEQGRVGSWNIQFLGLAENRPGIAKNMGQKAEDISAYIALGNVDILALQEICDDRAGTPSLDNSILDETIQLLGEKTSTTWKYLLLENRVKSDKSQVCGVLWNTGRVKMMGEPYRIPITRRGIPVDAAKKAWDRHPHAIKFSYGNGKADIVIVPIHAKSNVAKSGEPKPVDIRANEARQLIQRIGSIEDHFDDGDILLLGDTNVAKSNEPMLRAFGEAGFVDLNNAGQRTTYKGSASFDRVFVRPEEPETANATFQVIKKPGIAAEKFFLGYSDHYMVVATIEVGVDADAN